MTPQQARETAEKMVKVVPPEIATGHIVIGPDRDDLPAQFWELVTIYAQNDHAERAAKEIREWISQALTAARADERRKFTEAEGFGVTAHPGGWPVGEPTRWIVVRVERVVAWMRDGRRFSDGYVFPRQEDAEEWIRESRAAEAAALAARRKESGE